jgi:hypothetical protein
MRFRNNEPLEDETSLHYAPCQVCGCYHRVRNREEICCHCNFRRQQAKKQASAWTY